MASHLIPDDFITRGDIKPVVETYGVPLTSLRVHDAMATNLPATAANDDLALVTGTPGTDAPTVQAGDFGGTSITRYAGFEFVLPAEYQAGGAVTVTVHGGMLTSVADDLTEVLVTVRKANAAGTVSADLGSGVPLSMNSTTFATLSFAVTPTTLSPGDRLIGRIAIEGVDAGNAAVMIPEITNLAFNLTVRG